MAASCPGSGCGRCGPRWSSCRRATTTSACRLRLERQRVTQAIALIQAEAPQARIALVTVFPGRRRPAARVYQTDQAIVAAARAADPGVIIMDPLARAVGVPARPATACTRPPTATRRSARKVAEILRSQHGRRVRAAALARAGRSSVTRLSRFGRAAPFRLVRSRGDGGSPGGSGASACRRPGAASARTVPPWLSATWRMMAGRGPSRAPRGPTARGRSGRRRAAGPRGDAGPVVAHGELAGGAGAPRPGRPAGRTWPRCPAGYAIAICSRSALAEHQARREIGDEDVSAASPGGAPSSAAAATWSRRTSPGPRLPARCQLGRTQHTRASSVTLATRSPSSATWATSRSRISWRSARAGRCPRPAARR